MLWLDIMRDAQKRIEDIRTYGGNRCSTKRPWKPVPDAQVELRMNRRNFVWIMIVTVRIHTILRKKRKNGIKNCSLACLIMPPAFLLGDSMSL